MCTHSIFAGFVLATSLAVSSTTIAQSGTQQSLPPIVSAPTAADSVEVVSPEHSSAVAADACTSCDCQACDSSGIESTSGCNQPNCRLGRRQPASQSPAKPSPGAGSHKGVFYANDFSYLNDEDYNGRLLGDRFKQLSVGRQGKLDLGGQIRYRYHSEQGLGRQAGPLIDGFQDTQNDFGLIRLRLYANYQVNDRIRLYAEGIYADLDNPDGLYIPRGIDRNRGDFINLFADVKLTDNVLVRIGRQELSLGSQRFVSPLDWANTRRSFDGIRTTIKAEDFKLDAFYTQFVPVSFDSFDNPDNNRQFFGAYATFSGLERATVESYVLGFQNDNVGPPIATNFDVISFGSRITGSTRNGLLYESEGVVQTGDQNGLGVDHEAYAWTGGLGYQFKNHPWKPTLWGFYDWASGNDTTDPDFNRFNQLFPLGHKYLGFVDAVARANVTSLNARLQLKPTKRLSLLLWYYNFQAEENGDIIPGVAVSSQQDLTESDFGNELDFLASYQLTPRANITAGYSRFWRGARIIGNNDADFFYLQATTNF